MPEDKVQGSGVVLLGLGLIVSLIFTLLQQAGPVHSRQSRYMAEATPAPFVYLPLVKAPPPPTSTATPTPTPTPAPPAWLNDVNQYRAMAGLPPVTENPDWSHADWLHARYIVKNDVVAHTEDPDNPWFTPEGLIAAESSNLASHFDVTASDAFAIDSWMQAPFHAVGILDPHLLQVGFGSYREADGGLQMGAGLDVIRGLGSRPPGVTYPIMWPGEGANVPLLEHWGEFPSPLTSCPGYTTPAGLPLVLQLGAGALTPDVTDHSFMQGSTPLEHCVFDETNYVNPDGSQQNMGRAILGARDGIVLIPRNRLTPGATYTASITASGRTYTWSFTVSSTVRTISTQDNGYVDRSTVVQSTLP